MAYTVSKPVVPNPKLKLKLVHLHHRYITMKIIGINYYMLQKRDPRSNCF